MASGETRDGTGTGYLFMGNGTGVRRLAHWVQEELGTHWGGRLMKRAGASDWLDGD